MKIGIVLLGCDAGRSGIGVYALEMVRGLVEHFGAEQVELVYPAEEAEVWRPIAVGAATITPRLRGGPLGEIFWSALMLPRLAARRGWDVAFFPAGNRRLPFRMPCPVAGTVHDVSSLHVKNKYGRLRSLYILRVLPRLIRRLDRVVTVSHTSAHDIATSVGVRLEDIAVIENGVDHQRFNPEPDPEAEARVSAWIGRGRYLLYVSRIEHPGKNHLTLVEAFEQFRKAHPGVEDVRLVLAGPDREGAEDVHLRIARSPERDRILTPGFVEDADLPQLYRGAAATLLPSLYEGFGIPAIEAMATGCPLRVSDAPALVEVVDDAAPVVPARDVGAWAEAIETVLMREPSSELRAAGLARAGVFSWTRAVERTAEVLAHTATNQSGTE